jgi:molybdopterin/thiamine biosynthesis adenylyltransferase
VLPDALAELFNELSRNPLETAGVLLVGVVPIGANEFRLLGREYHPVQPEAYLRRLTDSLSIAPEGYMGALARAETLGATALWVHTHTGVGSSARPSSHDDVVDKELASTFRVRTGSDYYGTVIFSPAENGVSFTGHVAAHGTAPSSITRLLRVGDRLRLTDAQDMRRSQPLEMFDRNVRAFGGAVQETIGDLTIAVVGCGGTGSAVAEQLARLGVRNFVLIDPDTLSESNVTRVYGSGASDIGCAKVDVAQRNIKRIAPDARCRPIQSTLTINATAQRLVGCDVIFGCTDDNAGRLILSRIPTYLLIPVVDCGVLLSSGAEGELTGIDGRVTIVTPGDACLLCRSRVDVARAGAELLQADERIRLESEGYAPALGRTEPAVVTFTSMVASAAVGELLERLIGYGPSPRPSEVLIRYHERHISTNLAQPRANHYCHESSGKIGLGVTTPFLDLAWTA